jgi:hypothetical protein
MHSRALSFLRGSLILPTALASICFVCGCSDESHTTGTLVTRPPGADEAQKRSMEHIRSIMKDVHRRK